MTSRSSSRRAVAAMLVGLTAALVAAGCGMADRGASDSAGAPGEAPVAAPAQEGDAQGKAPAEGAPGQNSPARAPEKLPPDERSIIYTGTITVQAEDVNTAADAAIAAARSAGGFVGGDNRSVKDDYAEARVVLRVPADQFTAVVSNLAKLGKEVSREVKTEDVTEQVIDVTSRLATAQASVERVRALLARATALGEIVSLEAEVAKREAELESLKARLAKLTSLTAMSTITTVFVKDTSAPVEEPAEDSGFLAGLTGGWNAFTSSMQVLLTVLGALLPWFVVLGLPVLILVVLLRRNAARRTPALVMPAAPAPATASTDDD